MATSLHQILPTVEEINKGPRSVRGARGPKNKHGMARARSDGSNETIAEEAAKMMETRPELDPITARIRARQQYRAKKPMTKSDICNVELVPYDELLDALTPLLDAMGMARAMEEVGTRWQPGPVNPEYCDVGDDA